MNDQPLIEFPGEIVINTDNLISLRLLINPFLPNDEDETCVLRFIDGHEIELDGLFYYLLICLLSNKVTKL